MDEKDEIDWNSRWLRVEDKLDFLGGQLHALRSFAYAVIRATPTPHELQKELDQCIEAAVALSTPVPVEDSYLNGLHEESANLRRCVAAALERRSAP